MEGWLGLLSLVRVKLWSYGFAKTRRIDFGVTGHAAGRMKLKGSLPIQIALFRRIPPYSTALFGSASNFGIAPKRYTDPRPC